MVKRRNLNPDPKAAMADLVRRLEEAAQQQRTGAAGVTDLGEHGDVTWGDTSVRGEAEKVNQTRVELDAAAERIEAAEEELEAAKLELQEAAQNVLDTREDLTRLEEETLPAVVAELEEADRLANERLTAALQRIDEASGVVIDAAERLEETDRRLTALNTRVDEVGERPRVYRGAVPGGDAPMGSYWITDTDHLYVRVPCEEVPDGA